MIVATLDGGMHGVDAVTGKELWYTESPSPLIGSFQAFRDRSSPLIIPCRGGHILLFNASGLHRFPYTSEELVAYAPFKVCAIGAVGEAVWGSRRIG